jgi:hypothetical protein
MNSAIAFALLALTGCSAAGAAPPALVAHDGAEYVFSPDEGLEDEVLDAGASLIHGSGLNVVSGDGGVTVHWWGEEDDGPENDCAHTTITYNPETKETLDIDIAIKFDMPEGCVWPAAAIVEHEMIHALNSWDKFSGSENQEHSAHGLFQAHDVAGDDGAPKDFALEETSLAALCTYAPCTAFIPEAQ